MDSSQFPAPLRSRPSPSQSASATSSSLHKRKLPSDDLDSTSAAAGTADSEETEDGIDDEDDDDEFDDSAAVRSFGTSRRNTKAKVESGGGVKVVDEDEFDDSAIRNFNSARLESGSRRNTKQKLESLVKAEVSEGGGLEVGVKEEAATKSLFTENLQSIGAYCAREESLRREEEAGKLRFVCVSNDGVDEHMIWLIGLKNIFARQLPKMPKEYIVRLVMDRKHKSLMVIRRNVVVGGITYRPYISQKFGEIAFCAITADEQVKGYGTRLMNHLKQHARDVDGLTHFLTYADKNAVGYFKKQGFTKDIFLDNELWHGYIKDYDGGILMECKIDRNLPYTDLSTMIRRQRQAIDEKIKELSNCHIVYPGIDFQKKEAGIPKRAIKVEDIPGLREAGWTPDQWGHSRLKDASPDCTINQKSLTAFLRALLKALHDHADSWPFREPVDVRDVPDYYDVIKDPMDLKTASKRVESEQYYVTLDMFVADMRRMFANARTYNSPETIYYKCSTRLEAFFTAKVQAGVQSGLKAVS